MGLLTAKDPTYDESGQRIPHRNVRPRKRVDVPQNAVLESLARGRYDIEWFAREWLGIDGNPGQVAWWEACALRDGNGYSPKYLTTVVSAGNRAGKTLGMAVVAAHHAFYKLGTRPPRAGDVSDARRWLGAPYEWYHVAIRQDIAGQVHRELVLIFAGDHPAQKGRGCPLTARFGNIVATDKKFNGEYPWVRFSALFGGGQIHFRTTVDKGVGLLGKDMHGISFDEAGFELYLVTLYQEVLNLRRLSTGGPLHFIGTPTEASIAYRDLWEAGNPANPDRDEQFMSFRLSTRDNVGYGIDAEAFDAILRQQDEYLIPQNIDGYFIEARDAYFNAEKVDAAFTSDLPMEGPPRRKHRYSQGTDPGISGDATWSTILDGTDRKRIVGVRVSRKGGRQTVQAVVNRVREGHLLYSQDGAFCRTTVDDTAMGGKLYRQEFSVIKPLRGFDFGGSKGKKLGLLADLKAVIDRGELVLPRGGAWDELRRQLLTYRLDDKKIETDGVMSLALAVHDILRNPEKPVANPTFHYFGGA